ncbi:MAG: hypothetical protein PVI23_12140 [Maricaulaceae bacterium]|jgi:carnitine O-acetyltransferase
MPEYSAQKKLDNTGKIVLDDIYNAEDPASYYLTLGKLDYVIPEAARAVFVALIEALQRERGLERVTIADIGCSYGVNAAILKYDLSFSELVARYAAKRAEGLAGAALLRDDRAFYDAHGETRPLNVVGLDTASRAVAYAESAHIIDAALNRNLEEQPLDSLAERVLADVDLVISTGAVGYVGAPTFTKVLEGARGKPWVASFVLRQFDFDPIADALAPGGYVTESPGELVFPQRLFASDEERDGAMARLARVGKPPTPLEEAGWYASTLHVSRPADEARRASLKEMLSNAVLPASADVA